MLEDRDQLLDQEASDSVDLNLPDFGNFDIPEIDPDVFDFLPDEVADTENRYIKPKLIPMKQEQVLYDNAIDLAQDIQLDFGSRYDVLVSGSFIFGDFIEAFMTTHMAKANRMVISTLSLSQENIDSLNTLLEKGYIDDLTLIISTYFYNNYRHVLIPYLYERLDIENKFQLVVADVHTKTVHFETPGGRKVVIHGSANLRSNGAIEQFTIEENPELFDFYDERLGRITEKYATIRKAVRGKGLWRELALRKTK